MFAKALAGPLSRMGLHYGWVVVAVTFLVALTTAGAVGVPGACHPLLTVKLERMRSIRPTKRASAGRPLRSWRAHALRSRDPA